MTTIPPAKSQGSSPEVTTEYKDKLGNTIPSEAFENEPAPPRDPSRSVSIEDLAAFDEETEKLRQEADKIKSGVLRRIARRQE